MRTYLCLNGPDNDFPDDCFPTFSQLVRQGEIYTDSDMPYLIRPEELQSIIEDHEVETEMSHTCRRLSSVPSDTDAASWVSPAEIQDMISRHDMLIDEGWLSIDGDVGGQRTVSNSGSELLYDEGLGEIEEEERGTDLYRTGGGGRYQPSRRWQPVRRQKEGDLIGEPIDPQRGESDE